MKEIHEQALKEVKDIYNEMYRKRQEADDKLRNLVATIAKEDDPNQIRELLQKIPHGQYRMELMEYHSGRLADESYRTRINSIEGRRIDPSNVWNETVKGLLHPGQERVYGTPAP